MEHPDWSYSGAGVAQGFTGRYLNADGASHAWCQLPSGFCIACSSLWEGKVR